MAMVDWSAAALAALLTGILAHGWKGQSGVVWAVITLMLYFTLWGAWHLAVAFDAELRAGLDDRAIAVVSALLSAVLMTFGLWSLRTSK
jgi:hypothetical protein